MDMPPLTKFITEIYKGQGRVAGECTHLHVICQGGERRGHDCGEIDFNTHKILGYLICNSATKALRLMDPAGPRDDTKCRILAHKAGGTLSKQAVSLSNPRILAKMADPAGVGHSLSEVVIYLI